MANTDLIYENVRGIEEALSALARECRDDPDLRRRLDADPRAFFSERDLDFPAGIDFRVAADTPEVLHLVMPQDPNSAISDQELARIAGGTAALSSMSSVPSTLSTFSTVQTG